MKKWIFFIALTVTVHVSFAQADSLKAPYLKFPGFPPVKLLMPDSSSFFTKANLDKKKPVMLMLFNPQCEHCQHETEDLIKNIDKFKDVQIIMTTFMPFDSMMAFRQRYKLSDYKNISVVQDTHYFLPPYYQVTNLPFLAFYNKKKELISVFEGSMPIEKVLKELQK